MAVLTHDEIVAREKALYESCIKKKVDPVFAIAQDRETRWSAFMSNFKIRPEIQVWSDAMTTKHGNENCRMFNSTVSWVLALLIKRYGEAEYFWPTDGFTDGDVKKANEWLQDDVAPLGLMYLKSTAK